MSGFLRFFLLEDRDDCVEVACIKCPWSIELLDISSTQPLLPVARAAEDHYYGEHS